MPVRMLIILALLLAANVLVFAAAWLSGSELYMFYGRPRRPPTPTFAVAVLPVVAVVVGLIVSQHYALVAFSVATTGVVLGTIVGPLAFDWMPGVCQCLLTLTMLALTGYGWTNQEFFDY